MKEGKANGAPSASQEIVEKTSQTPQEILEAFTVHDPAASTARKGNETISETASFVQHYFAEGELATWFSQSEVLLYEEIMKYDDSHGEPHYHGVARLIGKKFIR